MNVLFVSTAGKDRAPTAEEVYKEIYPQAETKSMGTSFLDPFNLKWAERIYVMEYRHKVEIMDFSKNDVTIFGKILVLGIPADYHYNDPELKMVLKAQFEELKDK